MQLSTPRPNTARKPVARRLPYPSSATHTKTPWLLWYFRDLTQEAALLQAYRKQVALARPNKLLVEALMAGAVALKNESRQSLRHALEEGTLLFAWEGTTYFDQRVAA